MQSKRNKVNDDLFRQKAAVRNEHQHATEEKTVWFIRKLHWETFCRRKNKFCKELIFIRFKELVT